MRRARCWRQSSGTGPTVVLVHGTMDRSSSFGRVQRLLDGCHVVRYDRRGYGRSVDLGPPSGMDQQVDDLLAAIGDRAGIVFGHSFGGTIAMAAAQRAPERVRGAVVYECPLPWSSWWPATSAGAVAVGTADRPEDAAEAFMRRMLGDERWERLPPSTKAARRAEGVTLVAEIAQMRAPHEPAFDPAAVAVPVLAAHGTEGAPHHARAVRWIAEQAPLGSLEVVDGAGHGVHLTHPAGVVALVRRMAALVEQRGS